MKSRTNIFITISTFAGFASAIWGMRVPGGDAPFLLAGMMLLFAAFITPPCRMILMACVAMRKPVSWRHATSGWRYWAATSAAICMLVLFYVNDLPFRLAFLLSQRSLERFVERVSRCDSPNGPFWCGVFRFSSVRPVDDGMEFKFSKKEIPWGARGFYFSRNGRIENAGYYDQRDIRDGWHQWHYGGW